MRALLCWVMTVVPLTRTAGQKEVALGWIKA